MNFSINQPHTRATLRKMYAHDNDEGRYVDALEQTFNFTVIVRVLLSQTNLP